MEQTTGTRKALAAAIAAAAASAKVSQRTLSEGAGIPLATLSRGLNGHRDFNVDELARICVVVGKRPADLLAEAGV